MDTQVLHDGTLLVVGGVELNAGGQESAAAECYAPGPNRWYTLPPMNEARGQCRGCVIADGRFVVSGGRGIKGGTPLRSVEVFQSTRSPPVGSESTQNLESVAPNGFWSVLPSMRFGRIHHTTCNLGDDVLVMGGRQGPWGDTDLNDEASRSIELCVAVAIPACWTI
eukprot:SAG31_NODE_533_length_14371_cov_6.455367_14_plen_167_part_00